MRVRPDGTDDALTIQSDVDVAALECRRNSLPLSGKLGRSVGRKLAPQRADIGREGCAYDAPDLFALRNHRRSEGQHHGRRIPNKTAASAAAGRASFNPWEGAYALSKPRSRRPSPDAYRCRVDQRGRAFETAPSRRWFRIARG